MQLPSKVGYFTKTEFFLYCPDYTNGPKLQIHVGNLAQGTSVYYFVGKMKRSKSCEKCIFLPRRGVGVMCGATAALHSGRFCNKPSEK